MLNVKFRETVLKGCTARLKVDSEDEWGLKVISRTQEGIDFVASKARYHPHCKIKFDTNRALLTSPK